MPIYTYLQCGGWYDETEERNVPIEQRDNQFCKRCKNPLQRKIVFSGMVSSTAGGLK